jgi:hypothetical protein
MDEAVVYGWDDTGTTAEEVSFDALPEGEYDFEVRNVKTERYSRKNDQSRIPDGTPCANVQLYCRNDKAGGTVLDRLYLYSGGLGRITTFFKACGTIPADTPENAPMPASFKQLFDRSIGMTGRVKLTVRTYGKNNENKSNNVRYVLPEARPQQQYVQPQGYAAQPQYAAPAPAPAQPVQQQSWGGSWK